MTLTFRIEWCDNGSGVYTLPWLVHDDGRRRRASEEEAALWDALCETHERAKAAEAQRAEQAPAQQPEKARRK